MHQQIFELLSAIRPLSPEVCEALTGVFKREEYPKRTLLLKEGQVCDKAWFIEKGMVRAFYYLDGHDTTDWFMQEGDIIISVRSFFMRKPSFENIELLEDSTLVSLKYADLDTIYRTHPAFNFNGRVLTERYYVQGEERSIALRRQTAQERYQTLTETNPQLFVRAPLKHIASFLGMAPETLSRLRAREK